MKPQVLFDTDQLQTRAQERKIAPFKVKQIFFELFKNQNIHREEMTTLSKDLKADLASTFRPLSLEIVDTVESESTTKFVFQTHDGHVVEAILMFHRQDEKYHIHGNDRKLNRITLCISSQIGCPVNCLFCVTGKL
jgi:23S rRNA (adenine2503-C2)-methyltransferase